MAVSFMRKLCYLHTSKQAVKTPNLLCSTNHVQLFVKLGPVCSQHHRYVLERHENEGEESYSS